MTRSVSYESIGHVKSMDVHVEVNEPVCTSYWFIEFGSLNEHRTSSNSECCLYGLVAL